MNWYDLDENDQPVPVDLHDAMMNREEHRVGRDQVGPFEVSTVFLGLDHRHFGDGPPVLWESMVFDKSESDYTDLLCERYTSKAAAKAGHDFIIAELRAGKPPEQIELPS